MDAAEVAEQLHRLHREVGGAGGAAVAVFLEPSAAALRGAGGESLALELAAALDGERFRAMLRCLPPKCEAEDAPLIEAEGSIPVYQRRATTLHGASSVAALAKQLLQQSGGAFVLVALGQATSGNHALRALQLWQALVRGRGRCGALIAPDEGLPREIARKKCCWSLGGAKVPCADASPGMADFLSAVGMLAPAGMPASTSARVTLAELGGERCALLLAGTGPGGAEAAPASSRLVLSVTDQLQAVAEEAHRAVAAAGATAVLKDGTVAELRRCRSVDFAIHGFDEHHYLGAPSAHALCYELIAPGGGGGGGGGSSGTPVAFMAFGVENWRSRDSPRDRLPVRPPPRRVPRGTWVTPPVPALPWTNVFNVCTVERLCVLPSHRGRGAKEAIMDAVCPAFAALGLPTRISTRNASAHASFLRCPVLSWDGEAPREEPLPVAIGAAAAGAAADAGATGKRRRDADAEPAPAKRRKYRGNSKNKWTHWYAARPAAAEEARGAAAPADAGGGAQPTG